LGGGAAIVHAAAFVNPVVPRTHTNDDAPEDVFEKEHSPEPRSNETALLQDFIRNVAHEFLNLAP
jgi:hypothetical protein